MDNLIVLNLNNGSFTQGFSVTLQGDCDNYRSLVEAKLPANPVLLDAYKDWQNIFRTCDERDLVEEKAKVLREHLNSWLNSELFITIKDELTRVFTSSDKVRVLVQTNDYDLWRIPWQEWDFFRNYPQIEIGLSSLSSKAIKIGRVAAKNQIRILYIEGNTINIKTEVDIKSIKNSFQDKADIEYLKQPQRKDLSKILRDEKGWDIIFFAGHSKTDFQQTGIIEINEQESLTIPELKYALRTTIAFGLKLAIFNSCDGLGLARDIADLQIPNVVVMREPVLDKVAQNFVKKFLENFAENNSLYASVRQARESLKALEKDYPCASWLPVICQNPAHEPITFGELLQQANSEANWEGCCRTLLAIDALKRLNSNMLTEKKGLDIDDIYVAPNLSLVKRFKDKDSEQEQLSEQEKELQKREDQVPDTYKQDQFFQQVIQRGRSPYSQGRRIAIIGEAGIGKSLLLQRIGEWIVWESDSYNQVVIWVSLADLKRGQSLEDYIQQNWLNRAIKEVQLPRVSLEDLRALFASGKVFLLLDAADEMPVRFGNPLEIIVSQLATSEWLSQARILLTCRVNVWEANQAVLQNFDVYRHLKFSYVVKYGRTIDQVEAFISRWFISDESERKKGKHLRQELDQQGKKQIKDLATNPLLLSLLCLVWEERGTLPETKAELYQEFVEEIYKWKQQTIKLNKQKLKQLNKKLAELAKRTFDQGQEKFVKWLMQFTDKTELLELLRKQMLTNLPVVGMEAQESPFRIPHVLAWSILHDDFELALNLGWLNQVGVSSHNSKEAVYAFLHPSFHEYFAAQAINFDKWNYFLDHDNFFTIHPAYGTYRVFEQQWREVILFWFGRTPEHPVENIDKEMFIEALFKFKDRCRGFYALQAHFLAATALAEFRNCSDEIAEKIIDEVVISSFPYYIDDHNFSVPLKAERQRAYTALLTTNGNKVKDRLVELLNSIPPDYIGTRSDIADALLQFEPENKIAINVHIELMNTEKNDVQDISIAYSSMKTIRQIARTNNDAIKELKRRLSKAQNEADLKKIATTLGIITTNPEIAKKAINTLTELLYNRLLNDELLDYLEGFEEIAIDNIDINISQIVIERLTKLLVPVEYKQLLPEWKLSPHKIPWYERYEDLTYRELRYYIPCYDDLTDVDSYVKDYAITRYQHIRLCAALSLFKIDPEHKAAARTLVELLAINPNNYPLINSFHARDIRRVAADNMEKYGSGNQTLIDSLSEWISTSKDEDALWWVANLLGKVAAGTSDEGAIIALTSRIQITSESNPKIAETLAKRKPANPDAIQALTKLINLPLDNLNNSDDGFRLCEYIRTIGLIVPNHPEATKALIELQQFAQTKLSNLVKDLDIQAENAGDYLNQMLYQCYTKFGYEAAEIHRLFVECIKLFGDITREYPQSIKILTKLLAHPEEEIRFEAALSLAKSDPGNSNALNALINLHRTAKKEHLRNEAGGKFKSLANQVLEISDSQRRGLLINAITEIMETHPRLYPRYYTAEALAKTDPGNERVLATLLNLLKNDQEVSKKKIVTVLKETLRGNQFQQVVCNLKDVLQELSKNDDDRKQFQAYYELFWHCAENLNYPEFFQAFYNQSDLYHLQPKMLAVRALFLTLNIWVNIESYIKVYFKHPHYLIVDFLNLVFVSVQRLFYLTTFSIYLIVWPPLFVIYSLIFGIVNRKLWSNLFYILKLVPVFVWGVTVFLFMFTGGLLYGLWILLVRFLKRSRK